MPNGKTAVTAHFDDEEVRDLQQYMKRRGLSAQGNAVRKLTRDALQRHDPRNSWLLHAGLAAMLWSIMAVVGTLRFETMPRWVALFSIYMATVFLTAHAMQLVHTYGIGCLPVIGPFYRSVSEQ